MTSPKCWACLGHGTRLKVERNLVVEAPCERCGGAGVEPVQHTSTHFDIRDYRQSLVDQEWERKFDRGKE
jgi:hypothetical protein